MRQYQNTTYHPDRIPYQNYLAASYCPCAPKCHTTVEHHTATKANLSHSCPFFPPPQAFLSAETHEDSPVSSLYGIPLISNNSDSPHSTVFMYENNTAPDVQRDNTDTAKAAQLPHNFSLRRTQLWRQCRFHCCVYLPSA